MPLPSSRNTTALSNGPIPAVDFNAIQDCIVGLKHGLVTETFAPTLHGGPAYTNSGAGLLAAGDDWQVLANGTNYLIPIPLKNGDRFQSLTVECKGDGVADVNWYVFWMSRAQRVASAASPAGTLISNGGVALADNNRANAWGTLVIPITTIKTMADGDRVWAVASAGGGTSAYAVPLMTKGWDRP